MVEDDKYSDNEFESEHEMYLYWAENHMDDLTSHDKEKAKKALRKKEEDKKQKLEWRKKMMIRGVGGLVIVALVYLSAPAIANLFSTGGTVDFDEFNLDEQPMLGDEDAEVTVVEFGDYLCDSCKSFEDNIKPDLQEHIDNGDVKLYYLDFPLPNFNPDNMQAASAAQCVYEQDADEFWNMHSALYSEQNNVEYSPDSLTDLAEENTEGLDYEELESCIGDDETIDGIESDKELGSSNRVTGTPTLFIDGDRVSQDGVVEEVEKRIE